MILEELRRIKSFGSGMESALTPEDIEKKEAELGFPLPEALRELYLTFHPDDPIFAVGDSLIPIQELKLYKRICWTDTEITLLPFCLHEKYGFGFEVSRYHKKLNSMNKSDLIDPQVWGLYILPETNKEKKYLNGHAVPCNQANLAQWIVEWLGYLQVLAEPSVVAVNQDKVQDYWKNVHKFFPNDFYDISVKQSASYRRNFVVAYSSEPFGLLCGRIQYSSTAYFGGRTDQDLEQLMKRMGFRSVWIRSQTGHPIFNSAPPQPPKERELISIAPVLQFLCDFSGIEGRGAKEESVHKAEDRLGGLLPLPMVEFYRFLPSKFYRSYNTIRRLSSLKRARDGKLYFLEENQAVYHWAAEMNSPFLYRRANNNVGEWNAYGILDGFLAAEFLWALACDEELNLILWEFTDFEPEMINEGGKLSPYLHPIAGITDQISVGNSRKLYQAMDGKIVALYDSEEQTFWFVAREETAMEQMEEQLGLSGDGRGELA